MLFFRDPKIWKIPCVPGKEGEMIIEFVKQSIGYANSNEPLQIHSAFAPKGVKGFIYVEANRLWDIQNVTLHLPALRKGFQKEELMPINAITDALRTKPDETREVWCDLNRDEKSRKRPTYIPDAIDSENSGSDFSVSGF